EWEAYFEQDTMHSAARITAMFLRTHASMVMVDSGGVGGGVVDRLRMLQIPVLEVDFGSGPSNFNQDGTKYANKLAENWDTMRRWLKTGRIPERLHGIETTLVDELCAPQF